MVFKPGNKLGGRPLGAKNKSTIAQELRRSIFDEEVSTTFRNLIRKARPEYLIDQFLGKAQDTLDITSKGEKVAQINYEAPSLIVPVAPSDVDNDST